MMGLRSMTYLPITESPHRLLRRRDPERVQRVVQFVLGDKPISVRVDFIEDHVQFVDVTVAR